MDTTTPAEVITTDDAAHVLWHFGYIQGDGARQPGPFTRCLIEAVSRADYRNRAILANAYPSLSEAVRAVRNDEEGGDRLSRIARQVGGA